MLSRPYRARTCNGEPMKQAIRLLISRFRVRFPGGSLFNLPQYESHGYEIPISFIRITRLQLFHKLAKGGGSHEDNGGCR